MCVVLVGKRTNVSESEFFWNYEFECPTSKISSSDINYAYNEIVISFMNSLQGFWVLIYRLSLVLRFQFRNDCANDLFLAISTRMKTVVFNTDFCQKVDFDFY